MGEFMGCMIVLNIIAGILGLFFGYEIKVKKKIGLISDYKNKHIVNKDGYLNWVGSVEFIMGILMLVVALGTIITKLNAVIVIADIVLGIIFVAMHLIGDEKYSK